MTGRGRFLAGVVLGAAGAVLFGVGGPLMVAALTLGSLPLMLGGDGLAFLSGLLSAFGVAWLGLLAMQSSTNGEDLLPWVALGAVSLALGAVLGTIRARGARSPRSIET